MGCFLVLTLRKWKVHGTAENPVLHPCGPKKDIWQRAKGVSALVFAESKCTGVTDQQNQKNLWEFKDSGGNCIWLKESVWN